MFYDYNKTRNEFPFLNEKIYGKELIYFDNAATTQKPLCVLNAIRDTYIKSNGNVHRGNHYLSNIATQTFENARETVKKFLNARSECEIVFTKGATDSINLVASTYGRQFICEGDDVIVGQGEHHSNFLPWQELCKEKKAKFTVLPLNKDGTISLKLLSQMITERTKIVAVSHISNVVGCCNDIKAIADICHSRNIALIVDGAQAVAHIGVDVQKLDCDFYCFSGHKVYGPTGIGVLYGKQEILSIVQPFEFGGEMVDRVEFDTSTFADLPFRLEAGTPNYVGAIALAEAIQFVERIGIDLISEYEESLVGYICENISKTDGIILYGDYNNSKGIISFNLDNADAFDIGKLLDINGIEVRAGSHCAQPMMKHLNVEKTVRLSFGCYNTVSEIDLFLNKFEQIAHLLRG
ncbi:MAG: cysteine desulfurase [Clostridia bacterium]|nr:cysteine desulfurase [Clostridia bacterium]